jgi:hypothetical protein
MHVVDEHQLQSALGHQRQWGGKLGNILVQKGFCKEADVVRVLSQHLGMPVVKLAEAKIDPRAVKLVTRQVAEKLRVFPIEVSGSGRAEVVTIAMSEPTDLALIDQLSFHTGKRIKPVLTGESEITAAIGLHYGEPARPEAAKAAKAAPQPAATGPLSRVAPLPTSTRPPPPQRPPPVMTPTRGSQPVLSSMRVEPTSLAPQSGRVQPLSIPPPSLPPGMAPSRPRAYEPPPIPARQPQMRPAAPLEEIDAEGLEAAIPSLAPFTAQSRPVDPLAGIDLSPDSLPESDSGQVPGLESIAESGDPQEPIDAGEDLGSFEDAGGSPDEPLEGLEPLASHAGNEPQQDAESTPQEAAQEPPAAEPAAEEPSAEPPTELSWEEAPAAPSAPPAAEAAWEDAASGGWDDSAAHAPPPALVAPVPAPPPASAAPGWDEAPAPQVAPDNPFGEARDWSASEEEAHAAQHAAPAAAPEEEEFTDELPADAIIGTAEELEPGSEEGLAEASLEAEPEFAPAERAAAAEPEEAPEAGEAAGAPEVASHEDARSAAPEVATASEADPVTVAVESDPWAAAIAAHASDPEPAPAATEAETESLAAVFEVPPPAEDPWASQPPEASPAEAALEEVAALGAAEAPPGPADAEVAPGAAEEAAALEEAAAEPALAAEEAPVAAHDELLAAAPEPWAEGGEAPAHEDPLAEASETWAPAEEATAHEEPLPQPTDPWAPAGEAPAPEEPAPEEPAHEEPAQEEPAHSEPAVVEESAPVAPAEETALFAAVAPEAEHEAAVAEVPEAWGDVADPLAGESGDPWGAEAAPEGVHALPPAAPPSTQPDLPAFSEAPGAAQEALAEPVVEEPEAVEAPAGELVADAAEEQPPAEGFAAVDEHTSGAPVAEASAEAAAGEELPAAEAPQAPEALDDLAAQEPAPEELAVVEEPVAPGEQPALEAPAAQSLAALEPPAADEPAALEAQARPEEERRASDEEVAVTWETSEASDASAFIADTSESAPLVVAADGVLDESRAPAAEDAPAESAEPAEEFAPVDGAPAEEFAAAEAPALFTEFEGETEAAAPPAESEDLGLPGWVAPPPDPQPEGAGWLGQALAETTALSQGDIEVLGAAGIDPHDGVGALRLLAGLLRVLERRQVITLSELGEDLQAQRESAAASFALAAHAEAPTAEAGAAAPEGDQAAAPAAEEPVADDAPAAWHEEPPPES